MVAPILKPDFISSESLKNPGTLFGGLRKHGSVVRVRMPMIGKVWLTTTHAATSAMLKDDSRFQMRKPGKKTVAGLQWWMPRSIRLLAQNMLTSDEPDHRRLRKLVDQAFQRRPVREMESRIREIARDLLSSVDPSSGFDLVETYARRLPMDVIAELLGLEGQDKRRFSTQAGKIAGVTGVIGFLRLVPAISGMMRHMRKVLERESTRQAQGKSGTGLIAELVRVEHEGDKFSADELLAMVFLLLMAGSETTTHMISTAVWALENHPEQRRHFLTGESRALAIEELLRFCSPVQFSKPRYVTKAGDFHGAYLEEGGLIMAGLAAANLDPALFDRPDELNLERKPNPHLEFGTGIHFCLGFQLARMEIECALSELYTTMPDLRIEQPVKWRRGVGIRGLRTLMVRG